MGDLNDDSAGKEATLARLLPVAQRVYGGLKDGLAIAARVHRENRWSIKADQHLFHHMARREAMEQLMDEAPELAHDDNLGFPMSGLLLRPTPIDILRVWYTDDGEIRSPTSVSAKTFVSQSSTISDLFQNADTFLDRPPRTHRSYIQWTAPGNGITRFDLVRPRGIRGSHVDWDWRVNLLNYINLEPQRRKTIDESDD